MLLHLYNYFDQNNSISNVVINFDQNNISLKLLCKSKFKVMAFSTN